MNANGEGHNNQQGQRPMMTPADTDLGSDLDGEPGDTASAGSMPAPPEPETPPN